MIPRKKNKKAGLNSLDSHIPESDTPDPDPWSRVVPKSNLINRKIKISAPTSEGLNSFLESSEIADSGVVFTTPNVDDLPLPVILDDFDEEGQTNDLLKTNELIAAAKKRRINARKAEGIDMPDWEIEDRCSYEVQLTEEDLLENERMKSKASGHGIEALSRPIVTEIILNCKKNLESMKEAVDKAENEVEALEEERLNEEKRKQEITDLENKNLRDSQNLEDLIEMFDDIEKWFKSKEDEFNEIKSQAEKCWEIVRNLPPHPTTKIFEASDAKNLYLFLASKEHPDLRMLGKTEQETLELDLRRNNSSLERKITEEIEVIRKSMKDLILEAIEMLNLRALVGMLNDLDIRNDYLYPLLSRLASDELQVWDILGHGKNDGQSTFAWENVIGSLAQENGAEMSDLERQLSMEQTGLGIAGDTLKQFLIKTINLWDPKDIRQTASLCRNIYYALQKKYILPEAIAELNLEIALKFGS